MIRKAVKSDYATLSHYYKEFDEQGVDLFKDKPFNNVFIYEKDEKIAGFISYSIIYNRAEIEYIYVDSAFRNQKIAAELMEYCISEVSSSGCENITLEVNAKNEAGINLYSRFGFKKAAVRPKYYKGEDGLLMIRELNKNE